MMKRMWNSEVGIRKWAALRPNAARSAGDIHSAFRISHFAGFTLIELLVVIAIIAILAGLILNTAGYIQKKGAMSRATAEIAALETALEGYKAEYGAYPSNTTGGSNGSKILYNALVISNADLNPLGKVFFEPNKGMLFTTNLTTTNNWFIDPFGTSYEYRSDSAATNNGSNFFDLWSTGGSTKTNTWIKNW